MNFIKISDLFNVEYGVNLELINLEECKKSDDNSINFVSRTEKNNGISAYVRREEIQPNPAYTISVAGGGSVLATFFQQEEYYSGRDVYILVPKKKLSEMEMMFYCYCIRKNKYRYNYGRQANKTLKDIIIPEDMPNSWGKLYVKSLNKSSCDIAQKIDFKLNLSTWKKFKLSDIFKISLGKPIHSDQLQDFLGKDFPYITRTAENNGVEFFVEKNLNFELNPGGPLTIGAEGFRAFYQPRSFLTGNKVNIFNSAKLNIFNAMFIKSILDLEVGEKFNYGRGATKERLAVLEIRLPAKNQDPDWEFMENYVKLLPYSSNL